MDYEKNYKRLIEKSKAENENFSGYVEVHHIVPRCMGGTDDSSNLVRMKPEQHCVAHLLLVKMYPNVQKLVYAANTLYNVAKNNKQYGWLKRKFAEVERENKLGVKRSQASIDKQRQTILKKIADGTWLNPTKGKQLSQEHRKAISDSNKGKEIKDYSKSDLNGYILRYGQVEGERLYLEHNQKKVVNKERFLLTHSLEEWEEVCRKKTLVGQDNGFFGKTHDEETRRKISEAQKLNSGSKGKIWVNNGTMAFRVEEDQIPEGFIRGRGSRTLKAHT